MLNVFKFGWSVATLPFSLPWKAYTSLWWAFSPSAKSPAVAKSPPVPGQDRSFQVVDSRPGPPSRPVRALRKGFAATVALSGVMALLALGATEARELSPQHAMFAWAWATGAAWVTSYVAVRRWARNEPLPPRTLQERIGSLADKGVAMTSQAAAAAAQAARTLQAREYLSKARAMCEQSVKCGANAAKGCPDWFKARVVPAPQATRK